MLHSYWEYCRLHATPDPHSGYSLFFLTPRSHRKAEVGTIAGGLWWELSLCFYSKESALSVFPVKESTRLTYVNGAVWWTPVPLGMGDNFRSFSEVDATGVGVGYSEPHHVFAITARGLPVHSTLHTPKHVPLPIIISVLLLGQFTQRLVGQSHK